MAMPSPGPEKTERETMENHPSRIVGLDAFRLVAAFSVIAIHAGHFEGLSRVAGVELKLAGRWAVPFFFLVSGYFAAAHLRRAPQQVALQAVKSFWVLIVGSLCLVPLLMIKLGMLETVKTVLSIEVVTGGTYFHLWFLSSLSVGLFVFYALQVSGMRRGAAMAVLVSLLVLVVDAYYPSSRPMPRFARFLMCFPFLYFGMFINWRKISLPPWRAALLSIFGFALQNLEVFALEAYCGKSPYGYDFLVGTIPFSVGAFLLCLGLPYTPLLGMLSALGRRYALGIYVFHPYAIDVVRENWLWSDWLLSLTIVPAAFLLTLGALRVIFWLIPHFALIMAGNPEALRQADKLNPLPAALPRMRPGQSASGCP